MSKHAFPGVLWLLPEALQDQIGEDIDAALHALECLDRDLTFQVNEVRGIVEDLMYGVDDDL